MYLPFYKFNFYVRGSKLVDGAGEVLKEIIQSSNVNLNSLNSNGKPLFFDAVLYRNDNLAAISSIAVLPFEDLNENKDNIYFTEGLSDAIISHHTHNIQPYEFYQTLRDPHRKAPIFYGLGNLSSLSSAPHCAPLLHP